MARTRSIRLRVGSITLEYDDIHPEQLWEPGHEIYDWCAMIGQELVKAAKATAPGGNAYSTARWPRVGTGRLKAEIGLFSHRTGETSYEIILGSNAPYTMYVHGGTAFQRGAYIYSRVGFLHKAEIDAIGGGSFAPWTPIFARPTIGDGWFMKLKPGGGNLTIPYHLRVRGQRANPFLVRAYNRVEEDHPALGGQWLGVVGRTI